MANFARFHRFTVLVLVATLAVIVWGGYVRASGSGAGCGSHWPTCNGEILPRSPGEKTIVEFTHRLTSGIAFLLVAAQLVWALRIFPRRHEVRRAATAVFVLMVTEALVGAGLVIFEMVAGNTSTARAFWMGAHLLNTFALLAAMAVTTLRAHREVAPQAPLTLPRATSWSRALGLGVGAIVIVAMSGAVVALGDTLFPSRSLAEGFAQDLSPTAHLFIRLRVFHPVLAVAAGLGLLVMVALLAGRDDGTGRLRRLTSWVGGLLLAQIVVGFANLALLAPTSLQLLHLLTADLFWLALVVLTAEVRASARLAAGEKVTSRAALATSA